MRPNSDRPTISTARSAGSGCSPRPSPSSTENELPIRWAHDSRPSRRRANPADPARRGRSDAGSPSPTGVRLRLEDPPPARRPRRDCAARPGCGRRPRVSFSILCRWSHPSPAPGGPGIAAPVCVPVAMAATSPASKRMNPPRAARPPEGVTKVDHRERAEALMRSTVFAWLPACLPAY